jgi:hypothetical protein
METQPQNNDPAARIALEEQIMRLNPNTTEDEFRNIMKVNGFEVPPADADLVANQELVSSLTQPGIGETTSPNSPVAHEAYDPAMIDVYLGDVATREDWPQDRVESVQANLK